MKPGDLVRTRLFKTPWGRQGIFRTPRCAMDDDGWTGSIAAHDMCLILALHRHHVLLLAPGSQVGWKHIDFFEVLA